MDIKNKMKFLVILFSLSFYGTLHAAACTTNADGEITSTITTASSSFCTVTPDTAYFPLYKLGICTEVPTYDNYQTQCNFIINNATAQELEVYKGSSLEVSSGLTLTEGDYKAAVILLGNTISTKHSEVFATSQSGANSSKIETEGKYCSTRLDSGSQDDLSGDKLSTFECSTTNSLTAAKFSETSGAYVTDGTTCSISNGVVSADSELTFTTGSGSSVVCGMLDASTLETYDASSGATNATQQLVIQTFTTPVSITANTSSLDMGFKLDNMLSLEKYASGGTDYIAGFVDGIEFKITALSN